MPETGYTLLIVESPVIGRLVQKLVPSSVYVLATGGYPWTPVYDSANHRLKKVADPDKRDFRRELRNQARLATRIIIATDSDPSGDFIAWSLGVFLSPHRVQRGFLRNLTQAGMLKLLQSARELNTDKLAIELRNRYLIRALWHRQSGLPDYYAAALAALFGSPLQTDHFWDEKRNLYRSTSPLTCDSDQMLRLERTDPGSCWEQATPVSTFDAIEYLYASKISSSFEDAYLLLRQLFESRLPSSNASLISYPRTHSKGFYSDTWESFYTQYLQTGFPREFRPPFLRNNLCPEAAHESIHPLELRIVPGDVRNELHSGQAALYEWIYSRTLRAVTLPNQPHSVYQAGFQPDLYFYLPEHGRVSHDSKIIKVSPCMTIAGTGSALTEMGVMKPSRYAVELDRWLSKKWITVSGSVIRPGSGLYPYLDSAERFHKIFQQLRSLSGKLLESETVSAILSSY